MSKAVPHYSPEWLEAYNKRLAAMRQKSPAPKAKKAAETPQETAAKNAPALESYQPTESEAVPFRAAEGKQSKTEQKYNREVLGGVGRFEAVTLHLPGGGRYTPDFMTVDDGVITFHEVKGSYRLGSQGRAYTAFHDAAAYYPMWRFVWAHWTGKDWECKTVPQINI